MMIKKKIKKMKAVKTKILDKICKSSKAEKSQNLVDILFFRDIIDIVKAVRDKVK